MVDLALSSFQRSLEAGTTIGVTPLNELFLSQISGKKTDKADSNKIISHAISENSDTLNFTLIFITCV